MTTIKHPAPAHELDVAQHLAESTPEFMAAMNACLHLMDTLGQDHPDTTRAMLVDDNYRGRLTTTMLAG